MSSGFVSGGTDHNPVQNDDWVRAQREIEERRIAKAAEGKQDGGKSLYEVLQQNKAAKQEAFEESIRLKNQFRSLDEDEADFLESINESTRIKEEAIKRETAEQLEAFQKQREATEAEALERERQEAKIIIASDASRTNDVWVTKHKKRRRDNDMDNVVGTKLRKAPSPTAKMPVRDVIGSTKVHKTEEVSKTSSPKLSQVLHSVTEIEKPTTTKLEKPNVSSKKTNAALGLDYSSEEE